MKLVYKPHIIFPIQDFQRRILAVPVHLANSFCHTMFKKKTLRQNFFVRNNVVSFVWVATASVLDNRPVKTNGVADDMS